jgi:NAD(P)-dependent dehydrogenase (short-subunit alcohol dehydrogenase family)
MGPIEVKGGAIMTDQISFANRVAVVTGGGRGLGRAYAKELAARGAAIVIHDYGSDTEGRGSDHRPAHAVADEIVAAGGRALACTTDASTEAGGRAAVDMAVEGFGRLDAVVANAGIIHSDRFDQWTTDRFEAQIRHHVLAAFHVVTPAFAVMKAAGYGRLVFVSSAAGVFGQPLVSGYATSKTAMIGLMNVAAIDGAEFGIKANAILPMADTRMASALMGEAGKTPEAREFLEQLRVDQVAPVVAYLASERCLATHTILSAFRGRVAAVTIGVNKGWCSPTGSLTAEDVAAHLGEINDTEGMLVPGSIFDEMEDVDAQLSTAGTEWARSVDLTV